jgi:hypothetical protein
MTYNRMLVSLIFPLILIGNGQAGTASQAQGKDTAASAIRREDFLNFTYHPSLCTQEYAKEGIGKTVRVHNGEYKNNEVYYGVVDNKIIYGDLTHDGRDEAVVHIGCGYYTANYGLSEIFIFTAKGKDAVLLAVLNENDIRRDYQRAYPEGTLIGSYYTGVNVVGGDLVVEHYAEGAHCCPKYVATFRYRWNGASLARVGKIERRKFVAKK